MAEIRVGKDTKIGTVVHTAKPEIEATGTATLSAWGAKAISSVLNAFGVLANNYFPDLELEGTLGSVVPPARKEDTELKSYVLPTALIRFVRRTK
jgi:hypothetical protein